MTISSDLFIDEIATPLMKYPLNPEQRKVVTHDRGPLLVIAGPGSGKTRCLTLRAMNLLLLKKANPSQLVLCTYTEKAGCHIDICVPMYCSVLTRGWDPLAIQNGTRFVSFDEPVLPKKGPLLLYSQSGRT